METDLLRSAEVLTFDCYGTLIDWERGLLAALRDALGEPASADPGGLLERYAVHEARLEAGPYRSYREVLKEALRGLGAELGVALEPAALERFGGSVADWPAFEDSQAALARLARRYLLGVITNCDDDLFAASERRLGSPFTWVVTAQQAGAYKPSSRPFELALQRIDAPPERIVHVAQSLFHDHVTARELGLRSIWVDRRRGTDGSGATPPASASPDLTVADMATLARLAETS